MLAETWREINTQYFSIQEVSFFAFEIKSEGVWILFEATV